MTPQSTQLAKELTMEYVKQNKMLTCTETQLEAQIEKITKVSQIIYDSVDKNYHKFKFL